MSESLTFGPAGVCAKCGLPLGLSVLYVDQCVYHPQCAPGDVVLSTSTVGRALDELADLRARLATAERERDETRRELEEVKVQLGYAKVHAEAGWRDAGAAARVGQAYKDDRDAALARLAAAEKVIEAVNELFDAHDEVDSMWWDFVTAGDGRVERAWEALSLAINTAKSGEGGVMDYDKMSLGELINVVRGPCEDEHRVAILAAIDRGWPRQDHEAREHYEKLLRVEREATTPPVLTVPDDERTVEAIACAVRLPSLTARDAEASADAIMSALRSLSASVRR